MAQATDLSDRQFQRILVIKPSSLGDIIHALPVLTGLRSRYPDAKIAWLAAEPYVELLEAQPAIDAVILFDRRRYGKAWRHPAALADLLRFLRQLRHEQFDLVIDLQGLWRSGFFARITGAPVRIGLADAREGASAFYTHRISLPPGDIHAVDKNCLVADLLGFGDAPKRHLLLAPPQAVARVRSLTGPRPYVLLAPGARGETKIWPAEYFSQLADGIARNLGIAVALLGSPAEADLCRRVRDLAQTEPIDLAGQSSLTEMVAIIAGSAAIVCNDSGPMHIAAALDRPIVALFGPTNPARTGPHSDRSRVIQLPLPCAPCYFRRARQCPHDLRCMRQITPQKVLDTLTELMEGA